MSQINFSTYLPPTSTTSRAGGATQIPAANGAPPPPPSETFVESAPPLNKVGKVKETQAPTAANKPKKTLRNFLIGGLMVATLAGSIGSFMGPGGAGVASVAPDAGVVRMEQVVDTPKTPYCAPATLQDVQKYGDGFLMEEVCFDRAPTTEADFGRTPVNIKQTKGDDVRSVGGQTVHHAFTQDILKRMDGSVLFASPTETAVRGAFQNEGEANWTTSSQLQPAGQVKNFLSVLVTDKGATGGSSQMTQTLVTVDAQTGQRVALSDLIEARDFNQVVDQVAASLNSPRGADYQMASREELANHVNQNFGVYKEIDGTFKFRVIVPSQTQSNHGNVAEFAFATPDGFLQ